MERPRCSADGGGPADGDEGFKAVESSWIADAITHAVFLRFSPSLHHQMAKELQAIMAVIQEIQEVPEVQEMVDLVDQRERQDHQRNESLTAEMDNWSRLLLHSQV